MFRRNSSKPSAVKPTSSSKKAVPSVISSDVNFLGNIIGDGFIDFDGKIDGNITCHTLIIRTSAVINGEITADTVQIYGKVKGIVKAEAVHLFAGCIVQGVIMHNTIAIEDGASIDGKFKRLNQDGSGEMDEEFDHAQPPRILENLKLIAS